MFPKLTRWHQWTPPGPKFLRAHFGQAPSHYSSWFSSLVLSLGITLTLKSFFILKIRLSGWPWLSPETRIPVSVPISLDPVAFSWVVSHRQIFPAQRPLLTWFFLPSRHPSGLSSGALSSVKPVQISRVDQAAPYLHPTSPGGTQGAR